MTDAAERIEAATRRKLWAVLLQRHGNTLAELDRVRCFGAVAWEADLRRAVAVGDGARLEALLGSPPERRAEAPGGQSPRPRAVDARTRAYNLRVHPRALKRYDRLLEEAANGDEGDELIRARDALIEPPNRWPLWAAAGGALAALLILASTLSGGRGGNLASPESFPVAFATLGQTVEITRFTSEDGGPVAEAPTMLKDGVTIALRAGNYRLERRGGAEIVFRVPETGTVVLGPRPSEDLESALDAALEPVTPIRAEEGQ
jgi:hypothetical protein